MAQICMIQAVSWPIWSRNLRTVICYNYSFDIIIIIIYESINQEVVRKNWSQGMGYCEQTALNTNLFLLILYYVQASVAKTLRGGRRRTILTRRRPAWPTTSPSTASPAPPATSSTPSPRAAACISHAHR